MSNHEEKTQVYASWGDKLLQHTDVLKSIQKDKKFIPITIQLAPCEVCDSTCGFCSVAERPLKSYMPFKKIMKCIEDFAMLGAKSLEVTGGGNPLLYRDKNTGENINDIIRVAAANNLEVGIITNSHKLGNISSNVFHLIKWIRISLIKLDEGKNPEDYDFNGFPTTKMGFSYIIYDETAINPLAKKQTKTTKESIEKIAQLVELHPDIKFVRIAGNCLIKGNNEAVRNQYKEIIESIDKHSKFFIKDIGEKDSPYNNGCYVGTTRPYIAPNPEGTSYNVYTCTSHVLNTRTYDENYSLGPVEDIIKIWDRMSKTYAEKGYPYEVKGNCGKDWCSTCKYCYYFNNNKVLHTVAQEMEDRNFA